MFLVLARYYAGEGQYLEVNHHQQPKLCLPGPVSIFFNPIIHKSIITNESIFVNSNEALVVYQIHSDGEKDAFNKLAAKDKTIETGMILLIKVAFFRKISKSQKRIVFWNNFFWRFGDLKNGSLFLKKRRLYKI